MHAFESQKQNLELNPFPDTFFWYQNPFWIYTLTQYGHPFNIANNFPQLNKEEKFDMEKEISEDELRNIVYKSKNKKSPGPDGFSNEFYKKKIGHISNSFYLNL